MHKNQVSVVYICDEYYVMPTCVSIQSIFQNKKNSVYNIYILGVNLSEKSIKVIESINLKDINVKLFVLDNKYDRINTEHVYVSKAALFKFDIPNILPDLDKVLYLDSDTIVRNDLFKFFDMDISEYYAAVVKDLTSLYVFKDNERVGTETYFNSGMMLLNLKNLRADNIPEKLLEYKLNSKSVKYMDQDCFNVVLSSKLKFLPSDYNYMTSNENLYVNNICKQTVKDPLIIHFTPEKPWKQNKMPYLKEWKKYFKKSVCKHYKLEKVKPFIYKEKISNKRIIHIGEIKISYNKRMKTDAVLNVGIVTTWFERGAAYVSRQYANILKEDVNVFIYARGGEERAVGNPEWDAENVHWDFTKPFDGYWNTLNLNKFKKWLENNKIDVVLFNEQVWWQPVLYCAKKGIKTVGYVDYYKKDTVEFFNLYDCLLCNTKRHYEVFKNHKNAIYIPWGTNVQLFKPKSLEPVSDCVTFFHSYGYSPNRKGTDFLLKAFDRLEGNAKLIIQGQVKVEDRFPELEPLINKLTADNKLTYIPKTTKAPGLFYMGDVYVYPTVLDGIGLTQAEALASGLPIIVPDCPPMNEFVDKDFSSVVKIENYEYRKDNYYWPMCYVDVDDLVKKMQFYVDNFARIRDFKSAARKYALKNLDWNKNAYKAGKLFKNLPLIPWEDKKIYEQKIREYERKNSDKLKLNFAEKVFSVKNHKQHKVITVSGIHIKVKL